jgi:hypothetical protein
MAMMDSPGRRAGRADRELHAGYGDASACLKLRIPLTDATQHGVHQIACPPARAKNPEGTHRVGLQAPGRVLKRRRR